MRKIKVIRNIWGNLNGYIGSRRVREFGIAYQPGPEGDAREWLDRMSAQGCEVSEHSHIKWDPVKEVWK